MADCQLCGGNHPDSGGAGGTPASRVRVNAFYTQAPNENPRYTVDLAW